MDSVHKGSELERSSVQTLCAEHPQRTAVGTCERCGSYFCEECAGGARTFCKACRASRRYVAWEDRSLTVWQRYFRTVKSSIVELPKFAEGLPVTGRVLPPLVFALVPTFVSAVLGAALMSAIIALVMYVFESGANQPPAPAPIVGAFIFAFYGALGILAYVGYLVVWPAVLTATARVFGNRLVTYRGAFGVLCYASGLNCLYVVPLVGMMVALYHFVVAAVSIAALGRTSILMGFAICGAPAVLLGGTCLGGYVWLMLHFVDQLPNQ